MNSKEQAYERLVKAVQEDYKNRPIPEAKAGKEPIYVHKCKHEGKRINLWSYWQGSLEADILVVGQDWGCFGLEEPEYKNAKLDAQMEKNFIAMDKGNDSVCYFDGTEGMKLSDIDINLINYIKGLGTEFEEIKSTKNSRLFFTNLCLGYRNMGFSKGFNRKWINDDIRYFANNLKENAKDDDLSLLDIIDVKYVLCLGKEVFYAICEVLDEKDPVKENFYKLLDEERNCVNALYKGKKLRYLGLLIQEI